MIFYHVCGIERCLYSYISKWSSDVPVSLPAYVKVSHFRLPCGVLLLALFLFCVCLVCVV
jgi:hypothetical protein